MDKTGSKITFWELMNSSDVNSIEIPRIQRDYVQGREDDKVKYNLSRLITEMLDALENGEPMDLNFVYGKNEDGVFIPIDGQQRLTTLFCLHVYAFAKAGDTKGLQRMSDRFRYATRTSTDRFLKVLLSEKGLTEFFKQEDMRKEREKERADLLAAAEKKSGAKKRAALAAVPEVPPLMGMVEFIENATWYSPAWDNDPSVKSFKVVLREIHEKANEVEDLSSKLMDADCPITFMSLMIKDVGQINDLYIKMNSRGKQLTEFESFKSSLFDYVDKHATRFDKAAFKQKMDNEWLNMIWEALGTDAPAKCDRVYMHFLHQVFLTRLIPATHDNKTANTKAWKKLINNNGFFNFANYEPYLTAYPALLEDLYCVMELYYAVMESGRADLAEPLKRWLVDADKLTQVDLTGLAAVIRYATLIPQNEWDWDGFAKWQRVFTNLIHNTEIDKVERYSAAYNSLANVAEDMGRDAYDYLIATDGEDIKYFIERQRKEEALKCRLMAADPAWEAPILAAEANPYFAGEIRFAFSLCGIHEVTDVADHSEAIDTFKQTWRMVELLFADPKDKAWGDLFRRALLTYGNYAFWAKSSYTFFFESDKNYFGWRRMLREKASFDVFDSFFKDLMCAAPTTPEQVVAFFKERIDNYVLAADNAFSYYVVKIPEIMEYMAQKRFRPADDTNPYTIFHSKERLSADYAESNTFFVYHLIEREKAYHFGHGYLDSATAACYIEKIGSTDCHIEYHKDGYFCDEAGAPIWDAAGNRIETVQAMVDYIHATY